MAAPFPHRLVAYALVQTLHQISLGVVSPVVGLGADIVAPTWLGFTLPAGSRTGVFAHWAGDAGIDLARNHAARNTAGCAGAVRFNAEVTCRGME